MWKHRMRTWSWGIILLAAVLAFPVPALADASPEGLKLSQEIDGQRVELVFPEETILPGETSFFVRVSDAQGQPVEGLQVTLMLEAPAEPDDHGLPGGDDHAQQPADSHAAASDDHGSEDTGHGHADRADHTDEVEDDHHGSGAIQLQKGHGKGEYKGSLSFTHTGVWTIHVMLEGDHEIKEAAFALKVGGVRNRGYILGGFLALNVSIVLAAVVMKQKAADPTKKG